MADASSARQQVVDKIKEASNILVTVGKGPSVDELSAALGLTMMLNKLNKHATAVVSGDIPPAITFLDPEKTFENTVDSLRDFIIALDKEKADHLRYKVDGDVVKIFITPYRTTIGQDDLDFSQGDYNVELVLALGVKDEAHLDTALEAHGKILHDAVVATIDNEGEPSSFGSIDWRDETASSLSEMLVSISEAIKGDKALLDEQISTALLTGIVAATDRFSNEHTTSKVMTMSAQLMAAGANQQLIASKLEDANEIGPDTPSNDDTPDNNNSDGTTNLSEGAATKLDKSDKKAKKSEEPKKDDGSLAISHEKEGDLESVAEQTADEKQSEAEQKTNDTLAAAAKETSAHNSDDATKTAEQKLADELQATVPGAGAAQPTMGGVLNATTEQAAEDSRREQEADRNRTILRHDSGSHTDEAPAMSAPFNAVADTSSSEEPPTVDPFADAPQTAPELPTVQAAQTPAESAPSEEPATPTPDSAPKSETLADLDAKNRQAPADQPHEENARAAIDAAFADPPPATGLPPMPDFSTLPPPPPSPTATPTDVQSPAADAQQPSGAVPADQLATIFSDNTQAQPPADQPETPPSTSGNDPGEFKIPGQS